MEEFDFSKIFGETATSKASFTDENYINGWGYLGSTPPPYQLFDYLQGLNDKKSKYLYDSLNESKSNLLAHNTDISAHEDIRQKFNSYLSKIESETKLSAHNADTTAHSPILNAIKAITGTSSYDIAPSKTIAAIIPLLGFGGIVAQNLESIGYVKFANGFTIQWRIAPITTHVPLAVATSISFSKFLQGFASYDNPRYSISNYNEYPTVAIAANDSTSVLIGAKGYAGEKYGVRYVLLCIS